MSHIAALISNPKNPAVTRDAVEAAKALLPRAGAPATLDGEIASEIPFVLPQGAKTRALEETLRATLGAVDVAILPDSNRRKRLFVADMDSTMIEQECIDELADFAGLKAHVAAITERAMRGEIEFASALRERVALLKGLPRAVVDDVIDKRIAIMPGARTLVATMRASGAYTCMVSGGFTLFTDRIAAMIGFD